MNLFLLVMVVVAAALLFLSLAGIHSLGLSPDVERVLLVLAALATLIATGFFAKLMLDTLERRSRAR